jgi:cell division protein FtsZ
VIGQFASDNALVVVGTVLDDTIEDEIKVTVVATGLGLNQEQRKEKETRELRGGGRGETDFRRFDVPTVIRGSAKGAANPLEDHPEYLDIPAFLRRQAD